MQVSTWRGVVKRIKIQRMSFSSDARILSLVLISPLISAPAWGQAPPAPKPVAPRIEPGLENAVKWKWWVAPSDEKDWGIPLPEPEQAPATPGSPTAGGKPATTGAPAIAVRPTTYEVQRGDALAIISRKFSMTVAQLKQFNGLTTDTIRVGQSLKIPTFEEIKAMAPPPPPPEPKTVEKKTKSKAKEPQKPAMSFEATREMESVLLQAFLDREGFSAGPITGSTGASFEKVLALYRTVHDEVHGAEPLRQKAVDTIGEPFTHYTLKREDFRFIAPPKAMVTDVPLVAPGKSKRSSKTKAAAPPPPPPLTYDELTATPMLAYRTPWEFVAERFHCDESFLRNLNPRIKDTPVVGTEIQVPNVIPFEIEKAFDAPLQPAADPEKPVTAAVVEMSRIEIYRAGKLAGVMPMYVARPDLRGRSSWTVLDIIPRPRLATRQEEKEQPKPKTNIFTSPLSQSEAAPVAPPKPVLAADQYLAAGPNNPLGVFWINLAKAKSTEPLPYGLHGTSIPSQMKTQESLGGLRVANWDIARLVRLLPPGTPLQWK